MDKKVEKVKVIFLGSAGVGKTSIIQLFMYSQFQTDYQTTIGIDYFTKEIQYQGKIVTLQIWDTAGQEKFKSLSPIYFRNALGAVVVFSLVNRRSFEKLNDWITSFREVAGEQALVYIAANKTDLVEQYEISIDESREWAENHGFKFFATSAKTGENVNELFQSLAIELQKSQTILQVHFKSTPKEKEHSSGCC